MFDTAYNKRRTFERKLEKSNTSLPFRYVFVLTTMCNLRCSFCFQEKKFNKKALNLEGWKNVIDQIPEGSHLTLTGGEPLLFDGFLDLLKYIPKNITFNIITNGLLLDKKTSFEIIQHSNLKCISISIDDIGNKSRSFTEAQWDLLNNNINHLHQNLDIIKRKDLIFDIKSVIHEGNIDQIVPLANYSNNQAGADTHMFMFLKGSPIQHADVMFQYNDILSNFSCVPAGYDTHKLSKELRKLKSFINNIDSTRYFLHPKYSDLYDSFDVERIISLLMAEKHEPVKYSKCGSPWESTHINNDGNVFPCLAISVGNVKNKKLKDIFQSKETIRFRELINKCGTVPSCKNCGYLTPS